MASLIIILSLPLSLSLLSPLLHPFEFCHNCFVVHSCLTLSIALLLCQVPEPTTEEPPHLTISNHTFLFIKEAQFYLLIIPRLHWPERAPNSDKQGSHFRTYTLN